MDKEFSFEEEKLKRYKNAINKGVELRKFYDRDEDKDLNCILEEIFIDYNIEVIYDEKYNHKCKFDNGIWKIFLPYKTSQYRDNVAIATFLGKIVLNHELNEEKELQESPRDSIPYIEQHKFAEKFLIPDDYFLKKYKEFNGDEDYLSNYFSVPRTTILIKKILLDLE